jgi:hypothetical protein
LRQILMWFRKENDIPLLVQESDFARRCSLGIRSIKNWPILEYGRVFDLWESIGSFLLSAKPILE